MHRPSSPRRPPSTPASPPLSRRMVDYRGYWLANSFLADGAVAEYWACREKVAVIDLSALRKFEVLGPDAEALLDHAVTRDVTKLAVGQVVYTAICHPHGGMLDDGTVFRLGPQHFRLVCGDPYVGVHLRRLGDAARPQGLGALLDRPAPQHRGAGAEQPRAARQDHLDAADPARGRRARLVPLRRRPARRLRRAARRRLAHRLYRRARLRGLVPSARRPGLVGRGVRGRQAASASRRWGSRRSTCCASRRG